MAVTPLNVSPTGFKVQVFPVPVQCCKWAIRGLITLCNRSLIELIPTGFPWSEARWFLLPEADLSSHSPGARWVRDIRGSPDQMRIKANIQKTAAEKINVWILMEKCEVTSGGEYHTITLIWPMWGAQPRLRTWHLAGESGGKLGTRKTETWANTVLWHNNYTSHFKWVTWSVSRQMVQQRNAAAIRMTAARICAGFLPESGQCWVSVWSEMWIMIYNWLSAPGPAPAPIIFLISIPARSSFIPSSQSSEPRFPLLVTRCQLPPAPLRVRPRISLWHVTCVGAPPPPLRHV